MARQDSWQQKVQEQRDALNESSKARVEARSSIEEWQKQVTGLQEKHRRLTSKEGPAADVEAERQSMRERLPELESRRLFALDGVVTAGAEVNASKEAAPASADALVTSAEALEECERRRCEMEDFLQVAQEATAAAEERLTRMIPVEAVQRTETEATARREALEAAEGESRRLRVALAEALSSGADIANAMEEIAVLRESSERAAQRMKDVEAMNGQLETKLKQLNEEIAGLRERSVDMRSEEELMREVIVQQNEDLLRRVEELTDERKTGDADRKQLLETTAELLGAVEDGDMRIGRKDNLRREMEEWQRTSQTTMCEAERLRRTNAALCQQVLGEDSEGPLAGALGDPDRMGCLDDAELRRIYDSVCQLVRGRVAVEACRGDVRGDAATLALKLQTTLAEREEAFWVERQKLSDRVISLERVRGGRTGKLLEQYEQTARGSKPGAGGGSAVPKPQEAVEALKGGFRRMLGAT